MARKAELDDSVLKGGNIKVTPERALGFENRGFEIVLATDLAEVHSVAEEDSTHEGRLLWPWNRWLQLVLVSRL
ncbi:hypothetical protein PG994_013496 [Apiospora phragmitis]|uniref:Uncharacterized protein n=1 Tax=Apiospora phragmitis TaxID=2905665 RepID=A0ABR1T8W6_9PEZI